MKIITTFCCKIGLFAALVAFALLLLLAGCGSNAEIKYAYIDPTVKNKDLEGVLVVGVAPMYGGPCNRRFGSYYAYAYELAYEAPVTTTNRTITLVSDLYEVATEEHLWQAVSDAVKAGTEAELENAFIRAFVNNMVEQKLLD